MEDTTIAKIYSQWHSFVSKLDLELINVGLGTQITSWPIHKPFTGDNFFRIYLPLEGTFQLGYMDNLFAIEPGKMYLIPAQTPFSFIPVTPSDHYWIHFISNQLRSLPAMQSPIMLEVKNLQTKQMEFRKLFNKVRLARSLTDDLLVRNRIFEILAPFLELALQDIPQDSTEKGQFSDVLEYIDRNLGNEINIQNLNSMASLSRADFSALFRRTFGVPPKQYISYRRMTRAKYLLWRTKLSVKEIAMQCGYENIYFFYRIFKKYTGVTPTQYRQQGMMD